MMMMVTMEKTPPPTGGGRWVIGAGGMNFVPNHHDHGHIKTDKKQKMKKVKRKGEEKSTKW